MFRTTTLATLSVLALSGCIATPASAQYLYGNLHGGFAHGHSYSHHGFGHGYHHDSHQYLHAHDDYHRHGYVAYPTTVQSRHHSVPIYAGGDCPYENDAGCSESIGCPLQRGQVLSDRLRDEFKPGLGFGGANHNHSYDGHAHEGHSQRQQVPGRDIAPSDRGYIAPPSLPRDSARDFQPQQDFRSEQPQRDNSIRMDSPPPPSLGPSSPSPPSDANPKRFDTPPPSTV